MPTYNEGSVYRICNKNVGNPNQDPSVQDAFDECVEEVTRNIKERTSGMSHKAKLNPRFAMPEDYEDAMNPVPDRIQDMLDRLDDLEVDELESLSDEIMRNEYGPFDDLADQIREVILDKQGDEDYEMDEEDNREYEAERKLEGLREEGRRAPTRFGKRKNNEYAICTDSVGRADEAKYKSCKEQVKRKSSRQSGVKRMSSQLKSAIRTARSLMAAGQMGQELWGNIQSSHPTMTPESKKRLGAFLRKEIGFLGQVAHNPNLYPNCKTARIAKEQHPRKEGLILTYRTPMCASCTHNQGNRCALMGGALVAGVDETPETAVVRTANLLVNQEKLGRSEASRIAKAKIPAGQRVAAMHILSQQRVEDHSDDIRAMQGSRQAASILDPSDNEMIVPEQSLIGPGRVAGCDDNVEGAFESHAGDGKVSKRARRFASLLNPAEIPVEVPDRGAAPRSDVQMDPFATFTVPGRERRNRTASATEQETNDQARVAYNRYARLAGKLLAGGHLTTENAARLYARMDELKQFGVIPTERQSRVATQVGALAGYLEM